jgi:hydrogenase maturation protein HypF
MLPYTPLHLLLLEKGENFPEILVMTSGNLSEEPIAFEDNEAAQRLSPLVDGFLTHNREIKTRVDDSVVSSVNNRTYLIRRSRGYAPDPIRLPFQLPEIIGCGAELKNTFCLSKSNYAFISHHIGDLENFETLHAYESGIKHYQNLFRVTPEIVATDSHPDYLSTKYGLEYADYSHIPSIQIQHHHAHLASCLADNSWDSVEPVIGCILDGTGYGEDGHIWGGEFLLGSYTSYSRELHLRDVPLPGGDSSIRNPSKIGISYLLDAGLQSDHDLPPYNEYSDSQLEVIQRQISQNINTQLTSSMGRLFDAISSILGIRQRVTYEAQAAIELEFFCDPSENGRYKIELDEKGFDTRTIIRSIVADFHSGKNLGLISGRFHNTMAYLCLEASNIISSQSNIRKVVLSGGVWQNRTLLKKTIPLLENSGFSVLFHNHVPTNDGGISLGQVVIAAKQTNE